MFYLYSNMFNNLNFKIMKRLFLLPLTLSVFFIGCGPDEPENPNPDHYIYLGAVGNQVPGEPCKVEYQVRCSGPGGNCDFDGEMNETYHFLCSPECVHCWNGKQGKEDQPFKAITILNKYIENDSLSAFFTNEDWGAILPSMLKKEKFINFIKSRNDVRVALLGNKLVVFYLGNTFSMDKSRVLYICKINTNY
jgi:hypothetical protein